MTKHIPSNFLGESLYSVLQEDVKDLKVEVENCVSEEGDIMRGSINMGKYRITDVANPVNDFDVVNKKFFMDYMSKFRTENFKQCNGFKPISYLFNLELKPPKMYSINQPYNKYAFNQSYINYVLNTKSDLSQREFEFKKLKGYTIVGFYIQTKYGWYKSPKFLGNGKKYDCTMHSKHLSVYDNAPLKKLPSGYKNIIRIDLVKD